MGPRDHEVEEADARAERNGTSRYEELEDLGWSTDEIQDQFYDPYNPDPVLDRFLDERDCSLTDEDAGDSDE